MAEETKHLYVSIRGCPRHDHGYEERPCSCTHFWWAGTVGGFTNYHSDDCPCHEEPGAFPCRTGYC